MVDAQRYSIYAARADEGILEEEDSLGSWVKFSEYMRHIAELEEEIAELSNKGTDQRWITRVKELERRLDKIREAVEGRE